VFGLCACASGQCTEKTNGYIWPLGYKLRGISAMAEVEHLGGLCVHA
jgi:hypothetical protein